jgi:hypothetical protein
MLWNCSEAEIIDVLLPGCPGLLFTSVVVMLLEGVDVDVRPLGDDLFRDTLIEMGRDRRPTDSVGTNS